MQRALDLARKAQGFTSPNPMLGAVIVKRNIDYFVRRTSQADALVLDANGVIVLARLPSKPAQPVPVGRLTIFINWLRQPRP